MKSKKPSCESIVKKASKLNQKKDFYDVSAIFGRKPAIQIVRLTIDTPISPIFFTFLALIFGIGAAVCLFSKNYILLIIGAFFIQIKNIFDTVDGHLARARKTPSLIGRFLDSIVDFFINFLLFFAIANLISHSHSPSLIYPLALIAFLSSLLQCSYYVFYTMSYLAQKNPLIANQLAESITQEDYSHYNNRLKTKILIVLKYLFLIFYGWQDKFMTFIDQRSIKLFDKCPPGWYLDKKLLTLTSVLGLGVQLFLISFFTIINALYLYLWFIIIAGNCYWFFLILFRIKKFNTS